MATERTRRLIAVGSSTRRLNAATGARQRLKEEAIKLNRVIQAAQSRLKQIDEEEEVHSAAIEASGAEIVAAHAEPDYRLAQPGD